MRKRTFHTSMNLLLEPDMYQRIKMIAALQRTTMSKIIRESIKLWLSRYDKENNSVITNEKENQEGA